MDPVTQGAFGAVAGALLADRGNLRKAMLVSWAAGMLADADIFISSQADPLLNIEYHRHFSHSLLFIPVGALLCAGLFWLVMQRWWRIPFRQLYLFSFAGYATAGLLDACTSYGTRLWWPFSDQRVAWNIISIIDPIFTLTLLILLAVGIKKKHPSWPRAGFVFALCYLAFGLFQRNRTAELQAALADQRGHLEIDMATVKPSIGNLILWRSIYRHDDQFYVDAIRTGLVTEPNVYEGNSVQALALDSLSLGLEGSVLASDLVRFDHFSDSYFAYHPADPSVIGDLRYAMLPNSTRPLWGIQIDRDNPDRHVLFKSFREIPDEERQQLIQMLKGEDL